MKKKGFIFSFLLIILSSNISAQKSKVNWITFAQLEDSLAFKPKKTFIYFYAEWCVYCKKMNRVTFKNNEVIHILNANYYAVKMDAASKDSIVFDGITYSNKQLGKNRRPTHEIPLLLAKRIGKPFSLPVNMILDEKFRIIKRYFNYISAADMIKLLNK